MTVLPLQFASLRKTDMDFKIDYLQYHMFCCSDNENLFNLFPKIEKNIFFLN
jgi:hypothetical protein